MKAVIFGSGKIARGFIGQLLYQSNFEITFVEQNKDLTASLNSSGKYYVNVMGHPEESQWIEGFHCITLEDTAELAEELKTADIGFTAVGGKNLTSLAKTIASAYEDAEKKMGGHVFNLICCENWKDPAKLLKEAVLENLSTEELKISFESHVGISEAAILRSGVEATEEVRKIDPNAVSVTSYWELPVDRDKILGEPVVFNGVKYQTNFGAFLQRKIYTFNTTNATIAYIGALRGMEQLKDAANDPEIVELVKAVHSEMNPAIAAEMQVTLEEQEQFAGKALQKYQDKSVTDFTERHARDPLRKLGPSDRIVGTLRLIEKQGCSCEALATTLAAAIFYSTKNPDDPSGMELERMREEKGIDYILEMICKIHPEESLGQMVKERIFWLRERGWLNG